MITRRTILISLISVLILVTPFQVKAADGLPGSSKFGYGARVNLFGPYLKESIIAAGALDLDWISLDFDWGKLWPDENQSPNWTHFDQAIDLAEENDLAVMVSLTNPPDWTTSVNGPEIEITTSLILEIAHRYPSTVLAIEFFPGMNTVRGWGGRPNPNAYATLLKSIQPALQQINPALHVVTGGLMLTSNSADIPDLEYLAALYRENAADFMPIVGVRLPNTDKDPTTSPENANDLTVLRHYEAIRTLMNENDHSGLLWITGFSWHPEANPSTDQQTKWLKQAYLLFRGQLYIGAAFFQDLNPSDSNSSEKSSLITPQANLHPALNTLGQIITLEKNHQIDSFNNWVNKLSKNQIRKSPKP
jgi:hypothetical protein